MVRTTPRFLPLHNRRSAGSAGTDRLADIEQGRATLSRAASPKKITRTGSAMKISIVGGGATGITVLNCLAEAVASDRAGPVVHGIAIYDKCGFDGGLAYRTNNDRHLLNMKVGAMSAKAGDAKHFLRWLRSVGIACDGDDHVPRKFYKGYLDYLKQQAINRCHGAGVAVSDINDEVTHVRHLSDNEIRLETSSRLKLPSSVVVLCTGHS